MVRNGIHAASLESPRLQKFLAYMRRAGANGATTKEILDATGLCTVPANECRKNGIQVVCLPRGVKEDGSRIYRYWLPEYAPAA